MFDLPESGDFVEMHGGAHVGQEEIAVNGVPCFQWEAMVIPADAVSRNTISGNKGPTYYSARRMQQYFSENTRLLEDLRGRGQKVTIFPRHAAAMMESALPLGWVDHYELRPSQRRNGAHDMWYVANAPLTTEGRDLRMNMRAGLVQFSSLRTLPKPHLKTEPVKLNGQVVEEAVQLPIAGIDLVATQPGLPVEPIRVLEEAATIEAIEALATGDDTSRTRAAPQANEAVDHPDPSDPSASTPPSRTPPHGRHTQMGKYKCASCQADVDAVVDGALSQITEELSSAKSKLKEHKEARKAAEAELTALKAQQTAAEEAQNAEVTAKLVELTAKVAALESENTQLASVKAQFAAMQAREKVVEAVEEVAAEDAKKNAALVKFIRPFVAQAIEEGDVQEVAEAKALYWRVRSEHTMEFYTNQKRPVSGFGHVTLPAGSKSMFGRARGAATEEDENTGDDENDGGDTSRRAKKQKNAGKHAGALRGRGVVAEEDENDGDDTTTVSAFQADILGMMGRIVR